MHEIDAGIAITQIVYLQNTFALDRGNMIWFTIQLEVYDEGSWHPVLRCDTAHNEAHLDYLDPQGENYRKEWLNATAPYNVIHDQLVQRFRAEYQTHVDRWYAQKGRIR
ncbi:MAG: hypothetical protein QM753_08875 [Thermomicrobiales bacterium]